MAEEEGLSSGVFSVSARHRLPSWRIESSTAAALAWLLSSSIIFLLNYFIIKLITIVKYRKKYYYRYRFYFKYIQYKKPVLL